MTKTTIPPENRPLIKRICGHKGQIFTATLAKLYKDKDGRDNWTDVGVQGALIFMRDLDLQFTFRIVDIKRETILWEVVLSKKYMMDCDFFHIIYTQKGEKYGLSFIDAQEAKQFYQIVEKKRSEGDEPIDKKRFDNSLESFKPQTSTKVLTRDQISGPREFKHLRHVGYDQESGLLLDVSNSNQPAVFSVPPAKVSFPSPKRVSPPLPIANISRPAVVSEVIASKLGVPNYSVAPIKHAPSIPTKQLPIIPVRKIPPPPPPRRTVPVEPIIEEGKKVEENFTKPLVDRHLETSKQASKAVDTTVTPRPPAIKTAPPLPVSNIAHPPPVTKPAPQTVKKLSATKAAPPIPFPPSEIGNVATFKPIPPPLDQPLPEPVIDKILVAAKIETVPPPQPVKINTVPAPVPPPRPPQEDNMAPSRSLNSVPPPPAPSMIDTTPITVPPPPQNTVPPPPPQNNMKATAPIPPPPPPPQKKPESVVCPNKVITVTQDKPAAIATSSPSRDILLASIRESGISRLKKISPLTSENGNNNFSSPKKSPPRSAFEEMLLSAVKNSNHQKVKSAVASPNNNSNSASAITSGSGSPKDTSVWT